MGKLSLAAEVWLFLRQNKKLWLLPIIIVLLILGVLLIFAQSSALAPFIYTIF
jgi:drug/metabolite transporter superfamily protein YnfA